MLRNRIKACDKIHYQVTFQPGYALTLSLNLLTRRVTVQTCLLSPLCTVLACLLCSLQMTCSPDGQIGGRVQSHERGPASAVAAVSSSAATAHPCRILAFAEFKEGSFQLEPSEIPFQPLLWPGELQPRGGSRQYNDARHNNATVLQPVPRKPHNMCHCVPRFAARPRCLALAGDTESPGCTVMLAAAGLSDRFRGVKAGLTLGFTR